MIQLDKKLLILTAAFVVLLSFFPLFNLMEPYFFLLIIVLVGIPHGALDHIIHFKEKSPSRRKILLFYLTYIGLIGIVGISWFYLPEFSFIIFILISSYHFGQSQLFYVDTNSKLKAVLYLSWGLFLISLIICTNFQECMTIFQSLEWLNINWFSKNMWLTVCITSGLITSSLLMNSLIKKEISRERLFIETILLLLLVLFSLFSTAVLTFSLYFGIWHSYRSLVLEYRDLKEKLTLTLYKFVKLLLPFSLLATFFLFISYYLSISFDLGTSIYMVFIIIISTLTVPHLFVMNRLYKSIS